MGEGPTSGGKGTKYYRHDSHMHIVYELAPETYSDPQSAAIAALEKVTKMPKADEWEYGGVVVQLPGHLYKVTIPETNGFKDAVKLPADYQMDGTLYVDDLPVAARYHSHPCIPDYRTDEFSENDYTLDQADQADGYILSLCTGNVYHHVWDEKMQGITRWGTWKGHIVYWVPGKYSWDQETLKKGDTGCPTSIFIAPAGNLTQCMFRYINGRYY